VLQYCSNVIIVTLIAVTIIIVIIIIIIIIIGWNLGMERHLSQKSLHFCILKRILLCIFIYFLLFKAKS